MTTTSKTIYAIQHWPVTERSSITHAILLAHLSCSRYCVFENNMVTCFGIHSSCVIERDTMSLHPTFVEYMDGARLYLEMDTDKENASLRDVKIHFCDFIRKMIKNFSCKLIW